MGRTMRFKPVVLWMLLLVAAVCCACQPTAPSKPTAGEPTRTAEAFVTDDGTELRGGDDSLSDDDLRGLERLQAIKRVQLNWGGITDKGLGHVGQLQSLEVLELYRCDITDVGVAQLRGLRKIRELKISFIPVG